VRDTPLTTLAPFSLQTFTGAQLEKQFEPFGLTHITLPVLQGKLGSLVAAQEEIRSQRRTESASADKVVRLSLSYHS
jgi:hypothetical protein